MKTNIYTIWDVKAQRAIQPMMRDNHAVAMRDFVQSCTQEESPFFKNAEDYVLYWIGTWNDKTMVYNADADQDEEYPWHGAERVMTGIEALEQKKLTTDKIRQLQQQIDFIKENMPVAQQEKGLTND